MFEGSLWLFPDTALAAWLQSRIDVLCARFGTPRFRAHLTLLGGIGPIDEADAEIRTRELAPRLPPLLLEPTGLHGYDEYFRTLVLDVVDTPALCEARRLAEAKAHVIPGEHFYKSFDNQLGEKCGLVTWTHRKEMRKIHCDQIRWSKSYVMLDVAQHREAVEHTRKIWFQPERDARIKLRSDQKIARENEDRDPQHGLARRRRRSGRRDCARRERQDSAPGRWGRARVLFDIQHALLDDQHTRAEARQGRE